MKKLLLTSALVLVALIATLSQAQDAANKTLREKLVEAIELSSQNQLKIMSITATALPNMFEVELNTGEILYSDISGDYLFAGDKIGRASCRERV